MRIRHLQYEFCANFVLQAMNAHAGPGNEAKCIPPDQLRVARPLLQRGGRARENTFAPQYQMSSMEDICTIVASIGHSHTIITPIVHMIQFYVRIQFQEFSNLT